MHRLALVCTLLCTSCVAPLTVPAGSAIACVKTSDCPGGLTCEASRARCIDPKAPPVKASQLLGADALDALHVVLTFSVALDPVDAADLSHYQIDFGLSISSAKLSRDGLSVELTVDPQSDGLIYTVTVGAIVDILGLSVAAGSQKNFTGFGPVGDQSPPIILSPLPNAVQIGPVTLAWSHRDLAHQYVVDVASDSAFTQPIANSPFVANDPETTVSVTLLEPITYYWRVRADTTTPGLFSVSTVQMLQDTLYVFCPSTLVSCADDNAIGNQTAPFQTVGGALQLATAIGISQIEVAARGNGAAYLEHLVMGSGISLLGGYAPDFASRDATANVTVIDEATPPTLTIVGVTAPTTFDGFTIRGETDTAIAVSGGTGSVLTLSNNIIVAKLQAIVVSNGASDPGSMVITLNHMSGIDPGDLAKAVSISDAGATLTENTIVSGDNTQLPPSYALSLDQSSAVIANNTIATSATGAPQIFGVQSISSNVTINANVITVSAPSGSATGISVQGSGLSALVTNNVVSASGGTAAIGLRANASAATIISNNDFSAANATTTCAAILDSGVGATYENNVLFTAGSGATRTCFNAAAITNPDNSTSIGFFSNNLLFDCPYALVSYLDKSATLHLITDAADILANFSLIAGATSITANNVGPLDDTSLGFKAFPNDLHLTAATPTTVSGGGLDATQSVCGENANTSCGDVTNDFDGHPRTCLSPTACASIGAYELDAP